MSEQQLEPTALQAVPKTPTLVAVPSGKSWLRQERETPQAFEAWETYLAVRLEGHAGGATEAARRLGKNKCLVSRWCSKWKWVQRFKDYQNHQLLSQEREQQRAIREAATKWAERRIGIREEGFDVGQKLVARAKELLEMPIADQSPRDARLFAETGLKLMRLSADMSTENINLPEEINLDAMSDDELDLYATKLLELRQGQVKAGDV